MPNMWKLRSDFSALSFSVVHAKNLYVLNAASFSAKVVGMVLMKCKIAFFALTFLFAIVSCVNTSCFDKAKGESVSLPITSRSFWVGVTSTLSLNGTLEEVYGTAGSVADVMNLWFANVPWYNTTEHLKKPQTQGLLWLINSSGLTSIFS